MNYQTYTGTSGPYNFNGLVRHYYMRRQPNQADIQVNLLPAKQRSVQSRTIAKRLRPLLDAVGNAYGARIQVSEVPPGPPVVQTLVAEAVESPVYAILKMNKDLDHLTLPAGYTLARYNASMPESTDHYSMKWDGEWHITIEVFRDMGLAFAAVLVLIYVLVVGWFRSFIVPLIIMAPIPLTLVGIMPAHAMLGAFFTATSMIGFIAGAGIIVRNSIILVDFIELRIRQGMPLAEAVIDAGATRFRPMLLTGAAVVVGASVILTDPIFQGLALSLIAGAVASTFLSWPTIPTLYYMVHSGRQSGPKLQPEGGLQSKAEDGESL